MASSQTSVNASFNRLTVNELTVRDSIEHVNDLKFTKGEIFKHERREVTQTYKYALRDNNLQQVNKSTPLKTNGELIIKNVTKLSEDLVQLEIDIVDRMLGKFSHDITWIVDTKTGSVTNVANLNYTHSKADFHLASKTLTVVSTSHHETFTRVIVNTWKI